MKIALEEHRPRRQVKELPCRSAFEPHALGQWRTLAKDWERLNHKALAFLLSPSSAPAPKTVQF